MSTNFSATATNQPSSLFSKVVTTATAGTNAAVVSNNIASRTFSFGAALGTSGSSDGRKLKRIRPSNSNVTVSSKQFIFSESLHGGVGGFNSMSGFGDEGSNINYTATPSFVGEKASDLRSNNDGMSLFAKISSAKIGAASTSLKRSISGAR